MATTELDTYLHVFNIFNVSSGYENPKEKALLVVLRAVCWMVLDELRFTKNTLAHQPPCFGAVLRVWVVQQIAEL